MNNWKQLTIGEVCDFIGGSQPPKAEFSDEKLPNYIRLVQTRDFKTDAFVTYIPKNSTTKFFGKEDIMIGRYGPPIFQIFRGMEGAYNVALLKAKPKKNIINDYLYYFLKQQNVFEYVDKLSARTGGQTGIDLMSLNKYPIELPDLSSQQKIAAVLCALDNKIEVNNQINKELEQMAKTLYDYWFVQFDFPNTDGKPYKSSSGKMLYNEILKRDIPEGWKVKKLGNVLKTHLGGTPSTKNDSYWNGDIPWMNSGEVANFPLISTDQKVTREAIDNSSTKLLRKGSILLSITRHLRVNILGIDACINQSIAGIEENDVFKNSYIYFSVFNDIDRLMNLRTGAQQPHINKETVDDSPFVVANNNVLEAYYKKANPIFEKILNNAKQNQELSALQSWLLPMLMNGQVKIGDVTKEDNFGNDRASVAKESLVVYREIPKLNIPDNKKGFAKQVLAGRIVSIFQKDPNFTDIKFQKIQFLAEHIIEADLNLNYYYQAAGPYDNKFMHTIYTDFYKQKWFDCQNKKFVSLDKQEKIEGYYLGYFAPVQEHLNELFKLLYQSSEAEAEIIATLYAVWNNRFIEGRTVVNKELIEDFYLWSDRKQQYTEKQVWNGLKWLRDNNMCPKGFGKLIRKAKNKK